MSDSAVVESRGLNALRWFLGLSGFVTLVIGLLIFFLPERSAVVLTIILAVYAVLGGILYLAAAIAERQLTGLGRLGHALAGILLIVAGIIAFLNPAVSALTFAAIVVTFIGVAWIFEGVAALTSLSIAPSKGWAIFFAIVSILAGIALIASPLFAGIVLWIWFGISLAVMGVVQIVRAINLGR